MTETMYDLSERVALVTGAGQNVGAGIAHALARQGAQVLVNDIVKERADEVVHQITLSGGTARAVLFDVTNLDSVLTALAPTGPIDILVNNAGNAGSERMQPRPFVEMDPEAWESPIPRQLVRRPALLPCRGTRYVRSRPRTSRDDFIGSCDGWSQHRGGAI